MNAKEYFIDTSGFYALLDAKDPDHATANDFFSKITSDLLFTTNYIFDETMALVRIKLGYQYAIKLGTEIKAGACELLSLETKIEEEAWNLFIKRKDKNYSFTDCTSFVFCKTRKIKNVLSFDRHFIQEGFIIFH